MNTRAAAGQVAAFFIPEIFPAAIRHKNYMEIRIHTL